MFEILLYAMSISALIGLWVVIIFVLATWRIFKMSEKRFVIDYDLEDLEKENEQLRLELETHKHLLWSTREAERKVNKLADSLADEIKKNGLLNEEINQLLIENIRLKKKR